MNPPNPEVVEKAIRRQVSAQYNLRILHEADRNHNPFSEAHFKILKYRPDFPQRFGSRQDARAFCQDFLLWYNTEHHHSGIRLLTQETLHYGRAELVTNVRPQVLQAAYAVHPERFVLKQPQPPAVPTATWINKPDLG